jgi:hypothetical protein
MVKINGKFFTALRGFCPFSGVKTQFVNEVRLPDWQMYLADWTARRAK